jgi:spore coat protein H
MNFRALFVALVLLSACGGAPDPDAIGTQPSETETPSEGPPTSSDAGETPDAGTPPPDAGTPPPDAGTPPPDAGTPPLDAGTPPPDAGTPPPDAGTPPPDAGTPDAGTPPVKPPPRWPELQTSIPTWEIRLTPEALKALNDNIHKREYMVKGQFLADGRTYEVELRYRGRHTRFFEKKPWQVRFDKQDRFQGTAKRLELLAAYKDGGYLTEKLWYDLGARIGMKMPTTRYVHLYVNGKYEGIYTDVESIDKPFLEAHRFDEDGDVYRCGMHDCELRQPPQAPYMEPWQKRTNEDQPWDRLWTFLEKVNRTPPHEFRAFVERELALDDYLTWMALDVFIANYLQGDSRSYLVFDREVGRWYYVPWDLNNARSLYSRLHDVRQGVKKDHPMMPFTAYDPHAYEIAAERTGFEGMETMKPTWSTLTTRILDDEVLRARYLARLRHLLETEFTEDVIGPRIDAMHALIAPHILQEKGGTPLEPYALKFQGHVKESPNYLRRYVRERRAWMLAHLDALERHGQGTLVIDRVGRDASGTFWVQLYNRGSTPASLNGLYLSGSTRVPNQFRLPALSIPPQGVITLRQGASGTGRLGALMDPERPEVALYWSDGVTALDMLWLAPLAPGEAYGRHPRGAETFSSQPGP